tara:strand:- start:446 stop:697 length:252 start_codon:yes stop_codon:yes gene_type:complete
MKAVLQYIKTKRKQRKLRIGERDKLWDQLIKNDQKCRELRLQLARKNKKALTRQDYIINDDKVRQIIYLSLQQLKIKNQLKYD